MDGESIATTRSQHRCADCRALSEAAMPMMVAVEVFCAHMLAVRCPECGSSNMLMGQGRSLDEDRAFARGDTYEERVEGWLANGEFGTASKALFRAMSGRGEIAEGAPDDPGSLRRCMLLLDRVPEWRPRLGEMASISPEWGRIAKEWDALEATFRDEAGPTFSGGPAPRTAALVAELLAPATQRGDSFPAGGQ